MGLVILVVLSACNSTGTPMEEIAAEINSTQPGSLAQIVPGDLLFVQFPEVPNWNHDVLVRTDGRASFVFAGDLQVVGLSIEEVEAKLRARYVEKKKVVEDVTVAIKEPARRYVVVMGEVLTPGEVDFIGDRLTLIEAIGRAGGHDKTSARLEDVLLVRWFPKGNELVPMALADKFLESSTPSQLSWKIDAGIENWGGRNPILLQPYDLVYVPNTTIDEVDIWVDKYIRKLIPFPGFSPGL